MVKLLPRKPDQSVFFVWEIRAMTCPSMMWKKIYKNCDLVREKRKIWISFLTNPSLWWRKRGLFASLTKTGQRQIIVWVEYLQKKLIPKDSLRNGNYVVHVGNEWRRLWMICRSIEAPTPLVLPEGLQCSLLGRREYNEQERSSCFYFQQFGKDLKSD